MTQEPKHKPTIATNPFTLFGEWFVDAEAQEVNDPNAMSLATVGEGGLPSCRIMLMKGYDENGFCFFTNTQSKKGQQLQTHAKAALTFHWKSVRRQVRIEGVIEPVSVQEADEYFASRPRGSQIGAWASLQSTPLESREALLHRLSDFEQKYEGKDVPRPPHWSGYRCVPSFIEFWQDMPFRLHDRLIFTRASDGSWKQERWFP